MKNWETLEADENLIMTKHYTAGRQNHRIRYLVLHHNAANLSIRGCWNTWQTRQSSAHYQVDSYGRIGQLVWDTNTAWACGDWTANLESISIEHADISSNPWLISEATLDNGAHLVAALCKHYGLGKPTWMVNVFPHSRFSSTQCPASLAGSQNAAYMARAQQWYDHMTNGASAPTTNNTTTTKQEDIDMSCALMIRNDDTGLVYYWSPETGLTGLSNPDQMKVLETAGVKLMHASKGAPWWVRAQQITDLVQARTLAYETAQTKALETLAKNIGASPEDITAAVKTSVNAALANLSITLTNQNKTVETATETTDTKEEK
ncbi:N-acetylmuramyl-L-alanine amidase, negative regulator of AmpC, AmpD [Bifidobacterium saguini DSM 23967]|uniref:N-acetylmuramoyl-L-alanine amidase n=2 Tax=Bifidobacterium saguini TaxID=762210 RepID=A0A087D9I1_9BIFI|nr:peptidoglycan recognition family protein [Bifidobacterium saguini]KFI92181.1 N-acetylmuramyl-L-alanine amidase, negative regulator of AmpC, AmpD [Bifidobacterium saguini DSM 23967]QTB90855.1 N-acetylmuramoyl-L-alanine amidase [Bifidobacterium saguini]QTB90904.1 N-acetylmuramoyl-L-alanine amidase [Bifidobacterium saguini]